MTLSSYIIDDPAGLDTLAADWWDLWERSPGATPFQSPAWLIPWWRAFAPGSLHVMAVRRGGRLVGLAPCYVETGSRRLLPIGVGTSDYLDILLDPDERDEVFDTLLSLFERAPASIWEFPDAPPAARIAALAGRAASVEEAASSVCPVLDLRQGMQGIPLRQRRNLAMARNRADRRGGHAITQAAGDSGFLELLVSQHTQAWHDRDEPGVYADVRVRAHHAAALPLLAERGLLRAYVLAIAGTPAAAYFGFHWRDQAAAYLTGYDPRFAFESSGTLLMGHVIADAVADGAVEFHFLRGQEPYKYRWGARDRANRSFRFSRARAEACAG